MMCLWLLMSCYKVIIDVDNMDVFIIIVCFGFKLVGLNFRKIDICIEMIF